MIETGARRVATPEEELIFAVVIQAVDDLQSSDEQARFEAHEFFLQQRGGWADMRRFYFDLLGLDAQRVLDALKTRLTDPPERPGKTFASADDLIPLLPFGEFKAMDLADITGLRYSQLGARMQMLQKKGVIRRISRGVFARLDWLEHVTQPST